MQYTTNYNLRKPGYENVADVMPAVDENMDILDEEMKKISDGSSTIYATTNIGNRYFATIPTFTLQEGFPFALKFNAASSGNITININNGGDKNVYDYFGNRVNNVRKDLIANFRYDSVNSNFQLLGKGGGGNALPSQVLLDATYTTNSGPGVGIIPSKGTQIFTPGTADQTIAAGQYLSGPQVIAGDAELLPANIVAGINLFNVLGSATIESLGGRRFASGTGNPVNLGFVPKIIILLPTGKLTAAAAQYDQDWSTHIYVLDSNFHLWSKRALNGDPGYTADILYITSFPETLLKGTVLTTDAAWWIVIG